MAIVNVTDQTFVNEVEGQGTVVVDFWRHGAALVNACPILDELSSELGDDVKLLR